MTVPRITEIIGYSAETSSPNEQSRWGHFLARWVDGIQERFEEWLGDHDTAATDCIAELEAARSALAAVIEKVVAWHDEPHGRPILQSDIDNLHRILDAAPSDILAEHDARVIHEAAEAIRAHATAPTELIYPRVQIDALIAWVADWIENPPEWVHVSYRAGQGEGHIYRRIS